MKYIKKVEGTAHHKEVYEMHMTKNDLETLDLILTMYAPFMSSRALMMDSTGQTLKYRLKSLRMGVNRVKQAIQQEE